MFSAAMPLGMSADQKRELELLVPLWLPRMRTTASAIEIACVIRNSAHTVYSSAPA
jgi:hypothetical protein